jgi:hypothetical protein
MFLQSGSANLNSLSSRRRYSRICDGRPPFRDPRLVRAPPRGRRGAVDQDQDSLVPHVAAKLAPRLEVQDREEWERGVGGIRSTGALLNNGIDLGW